MANIKPRDSVKQQPKSPHSGYVDEVDAAERKFFALGQDLERGREASVAPYPDKHNHPSSLGDDEEDAKDSKVEDTRKENTARLEAASESVSAGASGEWRYCKMRVAGK
ncbi:hypothetical protein LTR08_004659 [Meristemomyces frigidus]|nr:hypothetical protein LTR08_004659 [Meristemomyces frigidus]